MAIWQSRIRHVTLTLSPFSAEQMQAIGNVMIQTETDRIKQGLDITDSPAKPLTDKYRRRKLLRGRAPIRDLFWRGLTLGSFKVKTASENSVTIGFVNQQADQIVSRNNLRVKQVGMSPKDKTVLDQVVLATLKQSRAIRVQRTAA